MSSKHVCVSLCRFNSVSWRSEGFKIHFGDINNKGEKCVNPCCSFEGKFASYFFKNRGMKQGNYALLLGTVTQIK